MSNVLNEVTEVTWKHFIGFHRNFAFSGGGGSVGFASVGIPR
jgi:hypothetical protein